MLLKARSFLPLSCLPAYRRLLVGDERRLVPLQVRTLGGRTVFARPRTADAATLSSVYRDRYHLPPRELPAASVILDLGCNCGYTIVHYKHLYPDARVVGVEMDADNVAVARRSRVARRGALPNRGCMLNSPRSARSRVAGSRCGRTITTGPRSWR